ncbi:MAG: hypothetical protein HOV83_09640, partial [Catenulispora sp.]|nr:hypothetical protein [Catenulispora sp.]
MSALVLAVGLAVCAFFLGGSGVERAMAAAPASATSVTVKATVTAANFARLDNTIRSRTAGALGTPAEVTSTLRSDAYAMPGQEKRDKPERLRFDTFDGIQDHARLVAGTWPASRAEPVEAAISQQAAAYTGFRAGQVVSLLGRIDGKYLKVKITGVYALRDPFGPRWAANQMISRGVEWDWYTTFGPLVVDRATFLDHFAGFQVDATWTFEPDLRGLSADRLSAIAARLGGLRADFERNQCPDCTPFSALPGTLAALESASAVARWTVVGLAAALAVAFLLASRRALSAGLAVAVLTCVAAVGGTWLTSVQDQRRFQVGAEVRLSGESDRSPGGGAVPGFSGRVEVNGAFVTLVALDAARLPQVYGLRPDLSERPLAELARGLERDLGAGTPIPGRPRSLTVQAEGPVPLELVVSDGLGVWRHLPLQPGANQLDVS